MKQMRTCSLTLVAFFISAALTCSPSFAASNQGPVATTTKPNGLAVNVWGDSLAAGSEDQSNVTLETALSADLGIPVTNNGVGSQKSTQIAMRQGGVSIQLTFSGNLIHYYSQAVSAVQGASVAGMSINQDPDYRFLSNTSSDSGQIMFGAVCSVHGILTITASGGPPSTAQSYYFTPDGGYPATSVLSATPQPCAANSVFTPDLSVAAHIQPAIFWYGRNNDGQPTQIESDLAASTAYLGHSNYLCLTIPNAEYEPSGSANYTTIATANAGITSTCGSTHTFDIREYLVEQYNSANPVDVYDHANDIVPYSLRAVVMRGTTSAISSTSTCTFTLAPAMGSTGTGVMLVDSEYIYISSVSGNNVTGCTRNYGTGGAGAATHSNGATVTITDDLHIGHNGDQLAAAYIAANYKTVLLGTTPTTIPNNTGIGGLLNQTNLWGSAQYFQNPLFIGSGEVWEGTMCIADAYNSFTQSLTGPLSNILCSTPGSGTITIGGAQNTLICLTMGGQAACTAGEQSKGLLFSNVGYADLGYTISSSTSGTVTIADTADTLILTATASTLTVQLPTCSSSFNGKIAHIAANATITTLTVTATAGTVNANAPTTLAAGAHAAFICQGAGPIWYNY